jgi:ABC-2 type transport system permease protein
MHRIITAELTKLRTLPVALWAIGAALLIPPVLAVLMGVTAGGRLLTVLNPEAQGFEVAGFGQPLVILLAAVVVGSEYRDGLLRSSVLAVPRRGRLLGAKVIVIAGLAFTLAVVSTGLAVLLRQAVLGDDGIPPNEFTAGMWLNVLSVGVNWMLIALISAALTVLARSALLPVIVLVPLVLGLGVALVSVLPWLKYAPDLAGLQLISRYPGMGLLDPMPGGVVMAAWAAALLLPAFIVFTRRDA